MFNIDISIHKDNFFSSSFFLDGQLFTFKFNYNAGYKFWSISIYDSQNNLFFATKIVCLFDFLSQHTHLQIPGGRIIFDTIYDYNQFPSENDFINKITTMKYISAEELLALKLI
jgi:hypothetical protein